MQELVNLILVDNVFSLVHIATCSLKNDLIFRQKEEAIDLMKCMASGDKNSHYFKRARKERKERKSQCQASGV